MKKVLMMALATLAVSASASVLAEGNADAGKEKATTCAGCHGADGNAAAPTFPKLAGQNAKYTLKQLKDFKSGARDNAMMKGQVAALSDQDMADLAAYYATQKTTLGSASEEQIALGQSIYRGGNSASKVTACSACHSPTGTGNALAGFPSLSGQHADYTKAQLNSFAAEDGRNNDPSGMMKDIAVKMTDKEIDAVAAYISALH